MYFWDYNWILKKEFWNELFYSYCYYFYAFRNGVSTKSDVRNWRNEVLKCLVYLLLFPFFVKWRVRIKCKKLVSNLSFSFSIISYYVYACQKRMQKRKICNNNNNNNVLLTVCATIILLCERLAFEFLEEWLTVNTFCILLLLCLCI